MEELARVHSPEELREDLGFLVEQLRATHCNLFHSVPEAEFLAAVERVRGGLSEPLTREQFYWRVAPLVALVGDGHTAVAYPRERLEAHAGAGGGLFPVDLRVSSGGLRVVAAFTGDARPAAGDSVVSIEGVEAGELVRELVAAQSAERAEFAEQRATGQVRAMLFERFGAPEEWRVAWADAAGARHAAELPSISVQGLAEGRARLAGPAPAADYSFRIAEGTHVGVIDFRSMNNEEKFAAFLKETFAAVAAEGLEAVVVDLRNNSGGSSRLGDMLLAYVTDKPYRQTARLEVRSSAAYRKYLKGHAPAAIRWLPLQWASGFGRQLWGAKAGAIVVRENAMRAPAAVRNRFGGPVFFLTGPRTYSSASMLASAVKDCGLGTLAGEETGGLASSYGELLGFTLPHTRLHATAAVKYFVRPNGTDDGRGVLPDIAAPDDPATPQDETMEAVLKALAGE